MSQPHDDPASRLLPLDRVQVLGSSGSGKTTFARELSARLGSEHIEMDALFWKPGWKMSTDGEFFPMLRNALSAERWILDGNYTRTREIVWERVQTVIWLDTPFSLAMARSLKRAFSRAWSGEELWPGTGNREQFSKLITRDSILWWALKTWLPVHRKYHRLFEAGPPEGIRFLRLRGPRAARAFLEEKGRDNTSVF